MNKVVCISNRSNCGDHYYFTINKVYEIADYGKYLPMYETIIPIVEYGTSISYYPKELFITLDEWRERQIEKII